MSLRFLKKNVVRWRLQIIFNIAVIVALCLLICEVLI